MKHKQRHWILLDRLVDVILKNVPGCVVDIGIGHSTEVLYNHSSKLGREHYSCDISSKKCNWARTLGGLKIFEGRSLDFIEQFSNIPVAVVFLDGDHTYSITKREFDFFLLKLSPGGMIFLHDTMPYCTKEIYGKYTVYQLRQEIERRSDLMVFTWPYTAQNAGLTMIMQKEKNPPFYRK